MQADTSAIPAGTAPRFAGDFHRPRYHFLPAANWMNDPNGVIQWQGRYHLFFQYNPDGAYHANMHWGHAVSDDLIHWRELPIAIAPTPGGPDRGGVFSGCMVADGGIPTAIYTGVSEGHSVQTQCIAFGSADLQTWEKYDGNPVISEPPPALGQRRDFRDPFVWRGADGWYLILASNIVGVGGAVLLYHSPDLRQWTYRQPLYVGDKARSGRNFECPNFFPLGDKWVLILSAQLQHAPATTLYFVGRFEGERFLPEREGVYDAGCSYASLAHKDEGGRTLIYSWLREGRSRAAQRASGWSGAQAIPRVLSLDTQNRLISSPVPALEKLRGAHRRLESGDETAIEIDTLALDIEAVFDAEAAARCGFTLDCGGDKLTIAYDRDTGALSIEREYAQANAELDSEKQGSAHLLDRGEPLTLRILLDGSLLELIANGRTRISSRFYPADAGGSRLRVIAPGAARAVDIWEMASIW